MDDIRERVREWDSEPVEDAAGVARLADREFTGALVEGEDVLFLLNGRAVGTTGKPASAFDGGRAHTAPGPALPLLFAMVENGGSTKTRGYTNDTPLREVDRTLQESNFTGYVELSENVLSGDYYLVYYGGRALYAAFVGTQEETITGDEALELADDEVGIYEVIDASVDVSDLPSAADESEAASEDEESESGGVAAGAVTVDDEDEATDDDADATDPDAIPDAEAAAETDADADASEPTNDDASERVAGESDPSEAASDGEAESAERAEDAEGSPTEAAGDTEPDTEASEPDTPTDASGEPNADDESAETYVAGEPADTYVSDEPSDASESRRTAANGSTATEGRSAERGRPERDEKDDAPGERDGTAESETVFAEEEEWRETTTVPALDPDETEEGERPEREAEPERRSRSGNRERGKDLRETLRERTAALEEQRERLESANRRVETLESELESTREERDELEARVEKLEAEREELSETVETLRAERDELEARVEELEARLDGARGAGSAGAPEGASLDSERALTGTNLFVRYDSKSASTLEDVTEGATEEEVRTNLRLDEHTTFDAEGATVEGEPFETFLRGTPEYAFVQWVVTELPFEIRDTGHESGLSELYDALPDVDRAELHGSVEVEHEEGSESHAFDVVLRDRMGEPLVVAEINAARDPVTGGMMEELVESASAVAADTDIGAALYVTESFFEPDALEAAEESAGGGLLSRSSKESYVRVERKRGFHLCLAESRDGSFYVTVPEL